MRPLALQILNGEERAHLNITNIQGSPRSPRERSEPIVLLPNKTYAIEVLMYSTTAVQGCMFVGEGAAMTAEYIGGTLTYSNSTTTTCSGCENRGQIPGVVIQCIE